MRRNQQRRWIGLSAVAALVWAIGVPLAQADSSTGSHRAAPSWDTVLTPTQAAPQAIGGYARGCQSGAEALPLQGVGYQILRPQRLRYYGQPALVRFVQSLAEKMAPLGHGNLLIGDMSQPRGGPMSYGHSSHQSGLDVDIWLQFATQPWSAETLRKPEERSVVQPGARTVDPARWTPAHEDLIRLAAQSPGVARIFVNPAIKASLCAKTNGQAEWLRVLRPWRGHDAHIHVRLTCPPGDALCENQSPQAAGTGCGADLMAWFEPPPPPKPNAAPPAPRAPRPPMPEVCQAVLTGQDAALSPAAYQQ